MQIGFEKYKGWTIKITMKDSKVFEGELLAVDKMNNILLKTMKHPDHKSFSLLGFREDQISYYEILKGPFWIPV